MKFWVKKLSGLLSGDWLQFGKNISDVQARSVELTLEERNLYNCYIKYIIKFQLKFNWLKSLVKNVWFFFSTSALAKQKCFLWCHVVNVSKQRFSLLWHADNVTLKKNNRKKQWKDQIEMGSTTRNLLEMRYLGRWHFCQWLVSR